MGIPESQLEVWSHQGSIKQSAATYHAIKDALEAASAAYHGKYYQVFLQGSYGNDTNIYSESDVDVVIRLDDVYYDDLTSLSSEDTAAYNQARVPATYAYDQYKKDVIKALTNRFGSDVKVGTRPLLWLRIAAGGKPMSSRRCSSGVIGSSRVSMTRSTLRVFVSSTGQENSSPTTQSSIQRT